MDIINLAVEAIDRAHTLRVLYEGKMKTIEVHAVGHSTKDGAPVIRGFQIDGEASRPLPCWALLRVEKIEEATMDIFESLAPRPGYAQGDKQMSKIIKEIEL